MLIFFPAVPLAFKNTVHCCVQCSRGVFTCYGCDRCSMDSWQAFFCPT